LKKEAITELVRLLPLLYPNNTDRDNEAVVSALEIWWETDISDPDFPLSAEWGKGSQHYWKRVLEERHPRDNGFVQLAEIAAGLIFSLFYLGRFVVLYMCSIFFFVCTQDSWQQPPQKANPNGSSTS
jgi:hypothetical protein